VRSSGYHVLTKTIQIAARTLRPAVRGWPTAAALATLALIAAEAQAPRVTLSVKPVLCITDNREESCALSILVSWRSTRAGNYCLHNDLVTGPLRCWQLAEAGMHVDERVVEQTFQYWLADGTSAARLAEARLDVLTADSDDRRRNRPRRHVWDIL
jgi:hypothetical protein